MAESGNSSDGSSVVFFQYMRDNGMDDVSAIEDCEYLSAVDYYNETEPESRYVHGITVLLTATKNDVFENNLMKLYSSSATAFCASHLLARSCFSI